MKCNATPKANATKYESGPRLDNRPNLLGHASDAEIDDDDHSATNHTGCTRPSWGRPTPRPRAPGAVPGTALAGQFRPGAPAAWRTPQRGARQTPRWSPGRVAAGVLGRTGRA